VKLLEQNLAKYKKTSVVGVSGMGKTQLARMYAKENSGRYDIIWFFDCNLDINAEFLKLAKAINKAYGVGSVEENAPTAKRDVMEYLTLKSNWLLVFDNLKIGDNVKVKDLVEWEHNGHVIFGSQEATNLPHVVEMIAFAKQDAEQLARNILVEDNVAAVEFLATEFKGYPILIVQGAQLLNYVKGLSFEEYKKQIQESGDKIELNILLARQQLSSSAQDLLNKIALINNQAFSKDFLKIISNDPEKIGDDIYQLSKFALISNIDSDQNNPVFEMHDVVASKLSEINVDKNRVLLEGVIDNVLKSMPEGLFKAYVFRHTKTFNSNLIVISQNLLNYNVSVYKAMSLNLYVLSDYATNCDFNNCEKIVEWFNTKDQNNEFKLWLMSNAEKHCYGGFLANIGRYIKKRFANNTNALKYYEKAKEVFDQTLGHEDWKFNLAYILAKANIELGRISEAIDNTEIMRSILSSGVLEKGDICLMHRVKAFTDYYQGNYESALIEVDQDISESIKYGIKPKDPVFTSNYILKSQLLNALGRYEEAYAQTQQLMEMHKDKKADHEIFGRILTHMAAAELGMQKVEDASSHIEKAVSIFEKDQNRSQDPTKSQDPDLAAAYVVKADILFAQDNLLDAIKYYRKAQLIYHRLYKAREKNIAQVSYLYKQGAKAACKAQNLTFYQIFGKNQYRQFGEKHPNTVEILEYCESLGMNLWDKNAPQAN
jgi:tetratricopeptide (TPR) repeat protein